MDNFFVPLNRDPSIQLSCSYLAPPLLSSSNSPAKSLVVCLNGIDTPQALWYPLAKVLVKRLDVSNVTPMLMYDRPGQGTTTSRNASIPVPGRPKNHSRDVLDAVHDLHDLLSTIAQTRLGLTSLSELQKLVIVANSFGGAIGRLYASTYPGTVAAILFLDCILTNLEIMSLFPNPDASQLGEEEAKRGITEEMCRESRKIIARIYGPKSMNREGLWRGLEPDPLEKAGEPKLVGRPWVSVVGHDPKVFSLQAEKLIGVPRIMTLTYFSPAWQVCNQTLATITAPERRRGPIMAKGCGHLIMKDDPKLVADELQNLLENLKQKEEVRSLL